MKRNQAYKFKLKKLSALQLKTLINIAGSCRHVYNSLLDLQQKYYQVSQKKLSYAQMCKVITDWKRTDKIWLNVIPSQTLQQAAKNLDCAYQNFFAKRASFPSFKKRYCDKDNSFRYPQGVKLDEANDRIYLPKIGWLRYHNSREVVGKIGNLTVSRKSKDWYISIQTEREDQPPKHPGGEIGIDVGIVKFATLSDGTTINPLNIFKKYQAKLAFRQRLLSKKKKRSNNSIKEANKIRAIHQKITNVRNNYLHMATHTISKNHAVVYVEDLQVKNMSKSAKGTIESPGKNVKAKSGLNKSILDQGWYEFRRQLEYKTAWRGGELIAVSPHHTSQRCPICDVVASENRLTQSNFHCINCQYENNADIVGAINILRAGHAQLACGEMVR